MSIGRNENFEFGFVVPTKGLAFLKRTFFAGILWNMFEDTGTGCNASENCVSFESRDRSSIMRHPHAAAKEALGCDV